jgi:L-asparaginase
METYGSGNAPSNQGFISLLKSAIDKGIIIVSVTQCKGGGAVEIGKYATSLELGKIGVISAYDMTLEAALTKLMYLLGQGLDNQEVSRWMQISLRGEITNPIR